MKRKIVYLLLITGLLGVAMYFLIAVKENSKNGFDRKLVGTTFRIQHSIKLDHDVFFSWKPEKEIWIGSRYQPFDLLKLNRFLSVTAIKKLAIQKDFNSKLHNFNFTKSDSSIFVANEVGQIARLSSNRQKTFNFNAIFDNPVAISKNTLIVRIFKTSGKENHTELSKIVLTAKGRIEKSYSVPKQVDGIFCADGQLAYDKASNRLFYMFYRRGSFLCLDTNLNLIYTASTIDTISRSTLKFLTAKQNSKNGKTVEATTLNSPANLVNISMSIANDKIYVNSGIKADNQSLTDFFENSTIDVYSVKNGTYQYSFQVPRYMGLLLREFYIDHDCIIALYDKCMVSSVIKGNQTI